MPCPTFRTSPASATSRAWSPALSPWQTAKSRCCSCIHRRGKGAGGRLLSHAIAAFGATSLDVNEQNEQAVGFYLHQGFVIAGRSELDGTGKPYPILHLQLRDQGDERTDH